MITSSNSIYEQLNISDTQAQLLQINKLKKYTKNAGYETEWDIKNSREIKSIKFNTESEAKTIAVMLQNQFLENKNTSQSDLEKHMWIEFIKDNKEEPSYQIIVDRALFQLPQCEFDPMDIEQLNITNISNDSNIERLPHITKSQASAPVISEIRKLKDYASNAGFKTEWVQKNSKEIGSIGFSSEKEAKINAVMLTNQFFENRDKSTSQSDFEKHIWVDSIKNNNKEKADYQIIVNRTIFQLPLRHISDSIPIDSKKLESYSASANLKTTWKLTYWNDEMISSGYVSKDKADEDVRNLISVIFNEAKNVDNTIEVRDIKKYIVSRKNLFFDHYNIFVDRSLFLFLDNNQSRLDPVTISSDLGNDLVQLNITKSQASAPVSEINILQSYRYSKDLESNQWYTSNQRQLKSILYPDEKNIETGETRIQTDRNKLINNFKENLLVDEKYLDKNIWLAPSMLDGKILGYRIIVNKVVFHLNKLVENIDERFSKEIKELRDLSVSANLNTSWSLFKKTEIKSDPYETEESVENAKKNLIDKFFQYAKSFDSGNTLKQSTVETYIETLKLDDGYFIIIDRSLFLLLDMMKGVI